MKVRDSQPVASKEGVEAPRSVAKAKQPTETAASVETVRSQELIRDARQSVAESRTKRLGQLKEQVRQGTYQPDPGRIANEMLNEAEVTAMLRLMLR